MMRRPTLLAGSLAALVLSTMSALAQNGELPATYGTVELITGFLPEVHSIDLQAGGDIQASGIQSGCVGMIAAAPDYEVQFRRGARALKIFVHSNDDTTLVVNAPDGRWYCSDDADGLDPTVVFDPPQSGRYTIWVGSFSGMPAATLGIKELQPGEWGVP